MRDINLTGRNTRLLAALMLFLAGFSAFGLLELPLAGVSLFVASLVFVTLAFLPTNQPQK